MIAHFVQLTFYVCLFSVKIFIFGVEFSLLSSKTILAFIVLIFGVFVLQILLLQFRLRLFIIIFCFAHS